VTGPVPGPPRPGPPAGTAPSPTAPDDAVPAVEEAAALLSGLDDRPVVERVAVLDEVHRRLQDALAAVDGTVDGTADGTADGGSGRPRPPHGRG